LLGVSLFVGVSVGVGIGVGAGVGAGVGVGVRMGDIEIILSEPTSIPCDQSSYPTSFRVIM
jgi:hypothetical protein